MSKTELIVLKRLLSLLEPKSPSDIDLWTLAKLLGLKIVNAPTKSNIFGAEPNLILILDDRQSFEEQRVDLAHELCHKLVHFGNQLFLPTELVELQEIQTCRMARYLLCPTELINSYLDGMVFNSRAEVPVFIGREFNVPLWFARKRMQMYYLETRVDHTPQLGRDYDTVWEHPGSGRKIYFKNGDLVKGLI